MRAPRAVLFAGLAILATCAAPAAAQAGPSDSPLPSWRIDTSHSELSFQIRHLLSRVRGNFGRWSGSIEVDPDDLRGGRAEVDIVTESIDTNNERRDDDLRGDDFFDAQDHPLITFRSSAVEVDPDGTMRIHGDLVMRGVSRPITLVGTFLGRMTDGQGRDRIGFEAETTISRQDFGITWNRLVEGGQLLGDEVRIVTSVQAVRQQP